MPDAQFVSGDLFVGAAESKNKPALALLEFLGSAEAQEIWAKRGGYIAPNAKVSPDVYPDENDRKAAELWPKSADVPAGYRPRRLDRRRDPGQVPSGAGRVRP